MATDDRRAHLELAVDLLSAAREITGVAGGLRGERAATLRKWADKFTDRGLAIVVDNLRADQPGAR